MSKRTTEEEVRYQESLKKADMRRAFVVFHDLMKARNIEYPFAVIWQTYDENGNDDYTVMCPSGAWDVSHGNKKEHIAEIVHDHAGKAEEKA